MMQSHNPQESKLGATAILAVLSLTLLSLNSPSATLFAADRVHLKLDDGTVRRYTGTIQDYNAKTLELDSVGGRSSLPFKNITSIETTIVPSLQSARDSLQSGKLAEAEAQLNTALREEKRRWMQREILAELVRVQAAQQNYGPAAKTFSVIYRDEPNTRFLDRLPLHWWPREITSIEKTQAETMLKEDNPAAQLVGASWLLAGENRAAASATLTELARSQTGPIQKLAQWQLWRSQVAGAEASLIADWEKELSEADMNLTAGAWLLVGRAKSNRGDHLGAATDFLKPLILSTGHEDAAAMGILYAARELDREKQTAEATRLRQELATRYAGTEAAARQDQGATIVP